MKILLITNKPPWPPKDGGSAATFNTIRGLASKGAEVTVLSFSTNKHFTDPASIPLETPGVYRMVNIDTKPHPLDFLRNLLFSDKPYSMERFESDEFRSMLGQILPGNYDIIHIEGLAMAAYLDHIRKLTDRPVIFRPQNIENEVWKMLAGEESNPVRKAYFRLLANRTLALESKIPNMFDGVAAITPEDQKWFLARGLKKPSVPIPPGIDDIPGIPSGSIQESLFYVGALDWRPNVNGLKWFIREVWPLILQSRRDATFHIAGRNPSADVRSLCKGTGIIFHGEVESSSDFMRDKQVMVVPLFSGSGIRMKIVEGMSLGKCIVATSTAARGLAYRDGFDIFINDDPSEFASSVLNLLSNRKARIETGLNAMENVRKNYDIFEAAERLLSFYSLLT